MLNRMLNSLCSAASPNTNQKAVACKVFSVAVVVMVFLVLHAERKKNELSPCADTNSSFFNASSAGEALVTFFCNLGAR